jgi:hypothetical protein
MADLHAIAAMIAGRWGQDLALSACFPAFFRRVLGLLFLGAESLGTIESISLASITLLPWPDAIGRKTLHNVGEYLTQLSST